MDGTQIDKSFYEANLYYNMSIKNIIDDICQPLVLVLNIDSFCYVRYLNNGYYIILSNNNFYQKLICEYDYMWRTSFFKSPKFFLKEDTFNKLLWPLKSQDELICRTQLLDLFHNVNLVRWYQNTFECVFFGASKEKESLKDLYFNHFKILENFIDYFKERAKNLINISDKSKLSISPYLKQNFSNISTLYKPMIKGKNFIFSPREIECLKYSISGRSAKEIAYILSISHRTVEKHFENIYRKTSCTYKSDLSSWLENAY